jgi:cellulose synthase/poly-beta-1,6-N-acetylglucosamine synthase-like glycosyltransferase
VRKVPLTKSPVETLILILYALPLLFVACFSLIQLSLIGSYLRARRQPVPPATPWSESTRPFVTIQLPVYNERYVIERLLRCVAQIRYPAERLEIQVLDDSTDDTTALIANTLREIDPGGTRFRHVRRGTRQGFKAGALAEGLQQARGEFIAVFDADFLPHPDFLEQTVPHFTSERTGMVQTRWEHLNRHYSLLTETQAFGLDVHFSVEQRGRNAAGHFINFNGTGGVWRTACVVDAGGWQPDTLTEDLDLSYRAQLRGWQFVYAEHISAPAELPVEMNALKSQQFRWMKGAAECARKHLFRVISTPNLRLSTKIHAIFHLLNSATFVSALVLALVSVPLLVLHRQSAEVHRFFVGTAAFQLCSVILGTFYWIAFRSANREARFGAFLLRFPLFLSVSMGLSLHNAVAVLEGYFGVKTPFVRTPKFNILAPTDGGWQTNRYLTHRIPALTWAELLLFGYFAGAVGLGLWWGDYSLLPFHLLLLTGYGLVAGYSLVHALRR